MNSFQTNLLLRRKYYRERRNTVRAILFFLFLISFILSVYFVLNAPNKKTIKIELPENHLLKDEYIINNISKVLSDKNFFFISPREVARDLLLSCGLFKDVVIRKYLFPDLKLIVFVREKQLWGKLVNDSVSNNSLYIANDGDLISGDYIDLNLLPENLTLVLCTNKKLASESALLLLKDALDFFNTRLKIKINKFLITDRNTLEIYTDNSIKIDAGYIDSNLLPKMTKLTDILNQIKRKSYLIQYIDLSLENGAVMRKTDENDMYKKQPKLFMILH